MKTLTEYLWFETAKKRELVRVTDTVAQLVKKSGTTAGVFVNDDEPGSFEDIWAWLGKLAPEGDSQHHATREDNGDRTSSRCWCTTRSSCR